METELAEKTKRLADLEEAQSKNDAENLERIKGLDLYKEKYVRLAQELQQIKVGAIRIIVDILINEFVY